MLIKTFPTLIYQSRVLTSQNETLKECLNESYKIRDMDEAGVKWSNKNYANGYTSYNSIPDLAKLSPNYADLKKKIDGHVAIYLKNLGFKIKLKDLEIVNLWVNIMGKGCTHAGHTHPNSIISGTIYLKTDEQSSTITFEDPRSPLFMNSPLRPPEKKNFPSTKYLIHPKAGEIILFESWLKHEVPLHKGKSDRISVSFNYNWARS